jgi:hypothetical protein
MKLTSHVLVGAVVLASLAALSSACSSTGDAASPSSDMVAAAPPKPLTFAETIEPLLQDKCQRCHHDGGIAPFPLVTYDDIKNVSGAARLQVSSRKMPPWGAWDDAACTVNHKWKDDLRLSDQQVKDFVAWVDGGMPIGDLTKRPPPRVFGPDGLADKTNTFTIPKPYEVLSGTGDDIRCFSIDPGFAENTWVGGANVVPGDPRVVHHVIVYVDPNGESTAKAAADPTGGYKCFGGPGVSNPSLLLAWAPGVPPTHYGDNAGIKVPKGSKLVLQIHYHPHPTDTANDTTAFELAVLPSAPSFVTQIILAGNAKNTTDTIHLVTPAPPLVDDTPGEFRILANDTAHVEAMEVTIPEKVGKPPNEITVPSFSVLAMGAHMHWAGVDMKIDVTRKNPSDGQPKDECLLGTPKYDFNWQRGYAYDEPVEKLPVLGGGDVVRFTCTYNNSKSNPLVVRALAEEHLAQPKDIVLGETTLDEMCLGVVIGVRPITVIDL